MIWVTEVKALAPYRLWLRFSDGVEGEVDLGEFIASDARAIVGALRDPAVFVALRLAHDTAVWDNGFDLAPEFLRARIKPHVSA